MKRNLSLFIIIIFSFASVIFCKKSVEKKIVIFPIHYNRNKYLYNKLDMVCSRISIYFYRQKKIKNMLIADPDWIHSIHHDEYSSNFRNFCNEFENKNVRFLIIVNSKPVKLDILYDLGFSVVDLENDCKIHKGSLNYRLKTQTGNIVNKEIVKIVDELTEIILKNE